MVFINTRYSSNDLKNNEAVRNEVLGCLIVDKYIHKNDNLYVGEKTDKNLPDIFNENKNFGAEVTWIEVESDYNKKSYSQKNYVCLFHKNDWMRNRYRKELLKKLKKLNNGNYDECKCVSLVVLSVFRMVDYYNAKIMQEEYCGALLDYRYERKFKCVYLISNSSIFCITEYGINEIVDFNNKSFGSMVLKMKECLAINEN